MLSALDQVSRHVWHKKVHHHCLDQSDYPWDDENDPPVVGHVLYLEHNADCETEHNTDDTAHAEKWTQKGTQWRRWQFFGHDWSQHWVHAASNPEQKPTNEETLEVGDLH